MGKTDQRRRLKLIPHQEALRRLQESIKPMKHSTETISVTEANGRVLSRSITSEVNIPETNRAVYDGYVVHTQDVHDSSLETPIFLRVVGRVFPGDAAIEFHLGEAVFTATGGSVPSGDMALVKVENVAKIGDEIRIIAPLEPTENIAQIGEDIQKGDSLYPEGHILRPQDIGLLAGVGLKTVDVIQKPCVGLISVGDELVTIDEKTAENEVVNNYAIIVSNLVEEFGCVPKFFGIVKDDVDEISERLRKALEESHMVLTISGCSVGPRDYVPDAVKRLCNPGLSFHGIRVSPGKVVGAGVVDGKAIIMLPGHIVSTYAGFYLYAAPLIEELVGVKQNTLLTKVDATMAEAVEGKSLSNFLRLNLRRGNDGIEAIPVRGGSSKLRTVVDSNGYTIVPAKTALKKGDQVEVILYGPREVSQIWN